MNKIIKRLVLSCAFALSLHAGTQITDTLYTATGERFNGKLTLSWNGWTALGGGSIAPGSQNITITGGALNINLEPNDTATPAGTYYTVWMQPNAGKGRTEYWYVQASGSALKYYQVKLPGIPTTSIWITPGQIVSAGAAKGSLIINTGSSWLPFGVCPDGQGIVADSTQPFGWTMRSRR
jgi:hypothetical protein